MILIKLYVDIHALMIILYEIDSGFKYAIVLALFNAGNKTFC